MADCQVHPEIGQKRHILKEIYRRRAKYLRKGAVYCLWNRDFKHGSYIIDQPGIYQLAEDITFHPNEEHDFRPKGKKYKGRPFTLDFFAAVVIQTKNVFLDLNGYTIAQSNEHALQQRFFSIVELASSPFIPKQGPVNFGTSIQSASYCMIYNGTLGRTAHHGIHGNGNSYCLFKDLSIRDFEVVGVALNGAKNIILDCVSIGPTFQQVPVVRTYSAARFLPKFYEMAQPHATSTEWKYLRKKLKALLRDSRRVYEEVRETGKTTHPVFGNKSGLSDGTNYGVLFHPIGVAVKDFIEEDFEGKYATGIYLKQVKVFDFKTNTVEIVGLSQKDGKGVQTDPSGSVFQILRCSDECGRYVPNVLTEAQLALAKFALKKSLKLAKLNITPDVIEWARKGRNFCWLRAKGYKFKCNGDSMHHVAKPMHGFRFDGVKGLFVTDSGCYDLANHGRMGNEVVDGAYETSHDEQVRPGYRGSSLSGWSFSRVINAKLCRTYAVKLHADNGEVRGYRFINGSVDVHLQDYYVKNLSSGAEYEDGHWYGVGADGSLEEFTSSYPNLPPSCIGVKIEDDDCKACLGKGKIKKLRGPITVPLWINL